MKRDLETREDLHTILRQFYTRLLSDKTLHPYFEKFRDQHILEQHLRDLVDFWDSALFYKSSYKKNVMEIHHRIHMERKLKSKHFEAWLLHFDQAVDKFYRGENSNRLKSRAQSIATVMQIKFHDADE